MASQPSGASSTNRLRMSSVSRIRQGAPGVSCSPAMNPSPSQRCRVEGAEPELVGGVGHGEQFSFVRVVGGWVAGDFLVVAQRLDPTGGERQSAGGAAVLPVEDVRDHRVGVVGGQAADQVDGVLVGAQPVGWVCV